MVDGSAFDRILQAGGYISVPTGSAVDSNAIPIPKSNADRAMDAAQCIGCGACVASCTNMQECEATCPKGISIENIAIMNRHFIEASFAERPAMAEAGAA